MADNIFEKVLENIDIANVVSEYVTLEPKGKNLFGLCPFHEDHSPSMSVSREKGIYYCFVCKAGGNAIKFVSDYKHMSYLDATKYLAQEYHIDISEFEGQGKLDPTKVYYDMMGTASKFFSFLMNDENYSKEARTYLNKRGITNETIKEFQIGLSSTDDNALTKTLESKGFILPDIISNSLANENNDYFIDRIIVPIRDEQGRTVAFGGRTYKESQKNINKYLNSKETQIFKKGELVFNLDRAIKYLKESNYLIINEGYMDVIQSCSQGIKNCVALMGTSLTEEQAKLIKKYTSNVVVCLDGDKPGIEATKSVVNKLENEGINVAITILKDGLDPDEYIRRYGKNEYLDQIVNHRLDKIGYLYELTKLEFGSLTSFNMESFKNAMFERIKDARSNSIRETYLKQIAIDLKVSYESISQDYISYIRTFDPSYLRQSQTNFRKVDEVFEVSGKIKKAEKMIIDYALRDKNYFYEIETKMESRTFLTDKNLRRLYIEIGNIYDSIPNITHDDLILKLKENDSFKDYVYDSKINFSMNDLIISVIGTIKRAEIETELEEVKAELKSLDLPKERRAELIKRRTELTISLKK